MHLLLASDPWSRISKIYKKRVFQTAMVFTHGAFTSTVSLETTLASLTENLCAMKQISTSLRKRSLEVSFRDMVAKTDERTRYLKSSIASYLENQSSLLNQSSSQTPRKRRLSRMSLGPRTPSKRKSIRPVEASIDCSDEYRGALQIGTARNVQVC